MANINKRSSIYLIILGYSGPAYAQTESVQLTDKVETSVLMHAEEMSNQGTAGGPSNRSTFGFFDPEIQIQGSDEGKSISVFISDGSSHAIDTVGPEYRFATDRFKLSGEVAIDRSSGEESPFRFGSIGGNGSKIAVGYTRFISGFQYDLKVKATIDDLIDRASYSCAIDVVGKWTDEKPMTDTRRNIQNAYLQKLQSKKNGATAGQIRHFVDTPAAASNGTYKELANEVFSNCTPGGGVIDNSNALISKYVSPAAAQDYGRAFSDGKPVKFFGVDGAVAREKFDFVDQLNFAEASVTKTTYEAAVFAGFIASDASWSFRGKLSVAKKYNAKEKKEFCDPTVSVPERKCISGPHGPPTVSRSGFISLEGRSYFGSNQAYAIAPSITFGIEDEEFAIDVPIYLSKQENDKLNAGFQVGYSSQNDEVVAGFFVGIPFSNWFSN